VRLMVWVAFVWYCVQVCGCLYHDSPLCFEGTNYHPFQSERKMCDVQETVRCETVEGSWFHNENNLGKRN
jgi:hypothetical protein